MKKHEVAPLYVEYIAYLDLNQFEDLFEAADEDERGAAEWAQECDAMARAESNFFERFQPHVDDMDHEDRMGWS